MKPEAEIPGLLPPGFSASGAEALAPRWWLSFNDPDLDALIRQALAGNFSLRGAWDRLAQAEALARKAGAALPPSVTGTAGARRTRSREEGRTPEETVDRTDLSLGVAASYEVDVWGRLSSAREAAEMDRRATYEQLQAAAITLSAEVASTWYALVEQRGQVDVLRQQTRANGDVLEVITARFRGGQAGAADVLRQRQLVESNRGQLVVAEAGVTLQEQRLAILLGRAPRSAAMPGRTALPEPAALPATGLPADLVQRRPDIRQSYFGVLAADRRAAAAVAERFPRISLSGGLDTSGEEWRDLFDNWLATLAANVVAPLFDAGARRAEADRARAAVSESLNTYGQTVLNALGEVENALASERRQREYLASLERQSDLARGTVERLKDGYLHGAAGYIDMLQAILSQQSLERTRLQARREWLQNRIDLCRALGGPLELTRPDPAVPRLLRRG